MAYHFEQSAAAVVVFLVGFKMLGKVVDSAGKNCHLNFRGAGIVLMSAVFYNDSGLLFF